MCWRGIKQIFTTAVNTFDKIWQCNGILLQFFLPDKSGFLLWEFSVFWWKVGQANCIKRFSRKSLQIRGQRLRIYNRYLIKKHCPFVCMHNLFWYYCLQLTNLLGWLPSAEMENERMKTIPVKTCYIWCFQLYNTERPYLTRFVVKQIFWDFSLLEMEMWKFKDFLS